ncbi:MAG: TetR/AcrR family transcriptional regulator [Acidimicrobiales bacterium]
MGDAQPVSRRRYNSAGRQARAAQLRRRIVAEAHRLFVADGYAGTTVADIAAAAEVSSPTVFSAFGSKAALLKACIDVALAGDDEALSVADRPLAQWVYDVEDPRELLRRYAVMMGALASAAAPIYDVLVRAADAEADLAALLDEFEKQRLRAAAMVAEAVAERGGLPPGRSVAEARDTVWLLNAPELYVTLTRKRRWSTRRYTVWAANALQRLLVDPPDPAPPPKPPAA